jgi:branched-chain amino acid transport system substrate-binding protein
MSRKLDRRVFRAAGAGGAAAARFGVAPAIAQAAPFKIGLLTVKTGPLAQGGIQMEQGLAVFLKEKANTLAGRKSNSSRPTPAAIRRAPRPRRRS